jgi:hypothetical protein
MFFLGPGGLATGGFEAEAAWGAARGVAAGMTAGLPGPTTWRTAGAAMPSGGRPGPPPSDATRAAVSR